MAKLEYLHTYDLHECDNLATNEHNIYLYSLNKESEPCLTVVKYTPFFVLQLTSVNKFKWNSKNIKDLIVELKSVNYNRGGRRKPLLDDNEYAECSNFTARNLHGYLEGFNTFLKIRFYTKQAMHAARERFKRAVVDFKGEHITFEISESDLESVRQFTMERKLQYANWYSIPDGKEIISEKKKISRFDHEYRVDWTEVSFPSPDSPPMAQKWRVYPRIAAYDIEAKADNKNIFPSPFRPSNEAFMISINYQQHAKPETRERICIVHGDAKIPPDTTVYFCESEAAVRKKFVEIIAERKVTIVAGHYNMGFDDWYLHQRNLNDWAEWESIGSMLKDEKPEYHDYSWSSNNTSKVDLKYIDFPGRITFDTKIITKSNILVRLPDYSLNTVSKHYLGKQKKDVGHEEIFDIIDKYHLVRKRLEASIKETKEKDEKHLLIPHDNIDKATWEQLIAEYNISLEEMGKLIDYCSEDSALVLDLLEKMNVWVNVVQAANIIQVRPRHVYTKGQQYKSLSQLYSLLKESTKEDPNGVVLNASTIEVKDTSYEGALNLGMLYQRIGFTDNTASIDINSMYPSIVLANNLCVSTEISPNPLSTGKNVSHYDKKNYNKHAWTEKTTGDKYDLAFVTPDVHFGFFPRLVKRLLTERGKVKDSMKTLAYDSFEYLVADAIQNALKVSANSVYGMLGTNKNPKVPAKHIAALVTKIGRDTDIFMAQFIENGGDPRYPADTPKDQIPNGISPMGTLPPGRIVYGDTDSVQFRIIGDYTVEEHIKFAKLYTDAINRSIAPLKIVLEKFGDMMVVTPKKYIFHFIDIMEMKNGKPNPNFGKYLVKDAYKYTGVEFIKRNQPEVLKRLYKGITDGIMSESLKFGQQGTDLSPEEHEIGRLQHIIDLTFTQLYMLIHNRNPLEDYIKYQQYTSDTGTLGPLAARLSEIGKPIQIGERVPYVIVNYPGENDIRKADRKKADKYRHFNAIGKNETIDTESYLTDLLNPIDNLICARYKNSKTYDDFFERKQVLNKVITVLTKKKLIDKSNKFSTTGELDEHILNSVLGTMKDPTQINGSPIGNSYTDLARFKESKEYKSVHRSAKGALTRALKTTTSQGLTLGLAIPTIISNIVLSRNLGILDEYAKIMMSDKAFGILRAM